jgi:hypothetical protein
MGLSSSACPTGGDGESDTILPSSLGFFGGRPRVCSENFQQLGLCRQEDILLESHRCGRSIPLFSCKSATHETKRLSP